MSTDRSENNDAGRHSLSDDLDLDEPLLLATAAARFFPDGKMTASGLRGEAKKSGLVIHKWANAHYTTKRDIRGWIEACRQRAIAAFDAKHRPQAVASFRRLSTSAGKRIQAATDALLRD